MICESVALTVADALADAVGATKPVDAGVPLAADDPLALEVPAVNEMAEGEPVAVAFPLETEPGIHKLRDCGL